MKNWDGYGSVHVARLRVGTSKDVLSRRIFHDMSRARGLGVGGRNLDIFGIKGLIAMYPGLGKGGKRGGEG